MGRGRGRGGSDEELVYMGCGCLIFSVLLTSCFLLGYSFDTLAPRRYGLRYDKITLDIQEDKVYESGRHFVGLGRKFIEFPRYAIYLEFSEGDTGGARNGAVEAWTSDGQSIVLEIGFYYRLVKEGLLDLYFAYRESGFYSIIEDAAAASFREVSTQFTAGDFFTRRNTIRDRMLEHLQDRLDATYALSVEILQFNFLSVSIPDLYESAVERRVVVSQQVETIAGPYRQSNLTAAEINWIAANADRARRITFASANRQAAVIKARASADAAKEYALARGNALKKLSETLEWQPVNATANATASAAEQAEYEEERQTAVQRILRYLWYKTVQQNGGDDVKLLVNYPNTVLQT